RAKYYSPSMNKTFLGPLPQGYEGYLFGPGVRALVVMLYYATGTSEPKILELLASRGVEMSAGELSNLLIHDVDRFHHERIEVQAAGLESSPWQQIDDTSTRINGVNHYCHVLGNPLYTIYRTMPRKDRPTVLAVLRGTETPRYLVNDIAVALAAELKVSDEVLSCFRTRLPWRKELDEQDFNKAYDEAGLGWIGAQTKRKLYEAAALAAYWAQTDAAEVRTLLAWISTEK
ncbi:MAG: transposase, partial [Armatimonadetes bacterium]|nr:transposase [Armatimonadota bacterium]